MTIEEIRKTHYTEKGREEGRKEGAVLARREDILDNLNDMAPVTDEIIKMVNSEKNIRKLKKWLKLSIIVDSLEEFLRIAKTSKDTEVL